MATRKEQLQKIFENVDENKKELVEPIIDRVIFLEGKLDELEKLPFIKVHPEIKDLQKTTPAGKQYKEFMQSYLNAIKVLSTTLSRDGGEENDEFDEFIKNRGLM